jgi:hypothetical protein
MPKGTTFSNDNVALIYNATAIANIADNAASSPITNIQVSMYTSSPGAAGGQNTNETSYTNYTRVAVARTTGGWSAPSGGTTGNVALIQFPQCGVTGATLTHVATGRDSSGAGKIFHFGALNSPLAVSSLIQPQFAASALQIQEA